MFKITQINTFIETESQSKVGSVFLLSLLKIGYMYDLGHKWIFETVKISNRSIVVQLVSTCIPICSLQVTILDHHLKVNMKMLHCFDLWIFKDFLTCRKSDIDVIHEDDTVTCLEVEQLL